MASNPGLLSDWPWKHLGSFKVVSLSNPSKLHLSLCSLYTQSVTHTPQNLCFKVRVLAFLVVSEAFFILGFMTILYLESFVSWILFYVCCCILFSLPPCSCWLYYGVWSMAATTFSLFQYISFIYDEKKKKSVLVVILFVKCGLLGLSTRFFGSPSRTSSDLDYCIRKEKYIYLAIRLTSKDMHAYTYLSFGNIYTCIYRL